MMIEAGRHAPTSGPRRRVKPIAESTGGHQVRAITGSSSQNSFLATEFASISHEQSPYGGPRIELLTTPDCPYATLAGALITMTLHELGLLHTSVLTTVIETMTEATRRNFTGSPTIVINGVDPWAQPEGEPGLACRVHPSPAGLPTPQSLAQALCAAVLEDHRALN